MDAVNQLVERETGVIYKSVNSYRKLLDEAGLSYQKVEFVDKHQNQQLHDDFQQQFEAKVKGGRISMWW
jgi:transposase